VSGESWRASVRARLGDFELDLELDGDARPLALIGQNGSGKTSLLRALAGAIEIEEAEIVVAGEVLASSSAGVSLPIEARRVGYVPQGYGLFAHLSVIDNVGFGLSTSLRRVARAERRRRAAAALDALDCADLAEREIAGLSGGEQQRVALARALVIDPALLLLDEPLAALDATTRQTVRRALAAHLRAFRRPALIVTHDVRDVVALDARVCVLERGRVIQRGELDDLRASPASAFVAEFVGQG